MLITGNMATAISKPTSHPPKMKRPPPPFVQTGVNGVKPQQSSSSPQPSSKRLPGPNQPGSTGSTSGAVTNGVNGVADANGVKGSINRPKKEAQKPGDQGIRLVKPLVKTISTENERRLGKKYPEPYVKTSTHILKKYTKCPPSLILHLHPTHFRFEQQDGSFSYNSEMKVIIEHIRTGTVPHDMIEELLRANVRFYEGCLIVRVVDHKSVSAQARKSTAPSKNDSNTPFSIHNYNEHVTPSAYVPYPKQNHLTSEKPTSKETGGPQPEARASGEPPSDSRNQTAKNESSSSQQKQPPPKPRVFTTVLHPTPRSLQAELTLLATTPDPRASKPGTTSSASRTQAPSSTAPPSPGGSSVQPERGHVAKRQKMLVEPQELSECESKLTRALAPPLFLEPVESLEAVQDLLKFMESPLHNDPPPSPKRRKRTVAELAADEALAAEEERFMLIMDERLEPTTSGGAGGPKSAVVDDTSGGAPFEPRFSRFKTLENIRMQHEEKAKREHEIKLKQELAKRQQQEQERERRRALEQRQAEEQAKEDSRRQHLAAQQHVQAQLAAQQQNRHVMPQTNGVSQAPQSSPVVRNQTPHNTSSPLPGNTMVAQGGVPMTMTSSMQGAGSPPRPPSALQHAHPNIMGHPMAPSRSQQGQSRHGTPQMTQGTPAMSHATPNMRNATPTQRMPHASPGRSTVAPTPGLNQAMMGTPQMAGGIGLTPQQQQQLLLQQRQQMLAQQGHLGHGQLTPQQFAQFQATTHAQQSIQSHQHQQMMQAQQQNHQQQQQKIPNPQVYQQQLMRTQFAQMQMVQQHAQGQQSQGQQGQVHQGGSQMNPQQQQMLIAAQTNGGQLPQNLQGVNMAHGAMAQRYNQLYQQRLLRLRQEMASRLMPQYGPPNQYPPPIAQQYHAGLERNAKTWVQEIIRRERDAAQQQRANQVAAVQAQVMQQQQQQNMMQNGMGN
ncbi:Spt20 family-domain-containing protein [Aspergillus coremiiformis]|uniref:Spt20 family-domain-containing protein n=1 Tax=Aspergillus coremiiformis TaxID=138285 RepID=A0A5N6YYJ9_9EURO|nr:Spt20 family-domain-containing protein [Aspergillus coremiiformis]